MLNGPACESVGEYLLDGLLADEVPVGEQVDRDGNTFTLALVDQPVGGLTEVHGVLEVAIDQDKLTIPMVDIGLQYIKDIVFQRGTRHTGGPGKEVASPGLHL